MADFKIGDVVAVDDPKFPGPWTVAKVNKATYTLSSADPRFARGLRAHHYTVRPFVGDAAPAFDDPRNGLPMQSVGALVKYTGRNPKVGAGSVFVVLSDNFDTLKVARLGGDDGRYWPKLNARDFEVFEIANVDEFKAVA